VSPGERGIQSFQCQPYSTFPRPQPPNEKPANRIAPGGLRKSVNLYLVIVSAHQFASGNWQDYKAQEGKKSHFYCVMNESLNKMLRPLESDQRLLIFRRKT
jgi:hypothetical protein